MSVIQILGLPRFPPFPVPETAWDFNPVLQIWNQVSLDVRVGQVIIGTLQQATFTVSGLAADDRISLASTGPAGLVFDGTNVVLGGRTIGQASGGIGTDFVVTFGPSSVSEIQQVINLLTWRNNSDAPTPLRTLTYALASPGYVTGTAQTDLRISPVPDPPEITSAAVAEVADGLAPDAVAYRAVAVDPDSPEVFFYLDGEDRALFRIDAAGQVRFRATPRVNAPADANRDNEYRVQVVAFDSDNRSSDPLNLSIFVTRKTGGPGADRLFGGPANDTLTGNGGNDVIFARSGNDLLSGGDGNDVLVGGEGNDTLAGGAGIDTADYRGSPAVRVNLALSTAQDTRGAGIDRLWFVENLLGGTGNDTLTGSAVANWIDGGAGNDILSGGEGNDVLIGGAGNDTIAGGPGVDLADYRGATAVRVSLATTMPQNTGVGTDRLWGIENLTGGSGNDTLIGSVGANRIDGGLGNDAIAGGAGDNLLIGGAGADTLTGEAGADVFVYRATAESTPMLRDLIRGFDGPGAAPGDRIDVSAIDADLTRAGMQDFVFGTATGVGRLYARNVGTETVIFGNVDDDPEPELAIRIADGAVLASAYGSADFIV